MNYKLKSLLQAPLRGLTMAGACALLAVASASILEAQQPPGPRDTRLPSENDQLIALNRGPVHEAFAQPYEMKSGGDFIVNKEPPQPIEEVPPRQVPQSSEYQWISGYWGWEPGEERYIWISGIFRKAPEEMKWNPGYWTQAESGYAWVSGCWVRDEQLYLISQTPPDPKPENPGQPPSPQHFWVPGHWDYVQRDFEWQPGFWARGIEDRVWVPARYLWTPRGYLAVDGYWDYPLEERGVLYSPVAFRDIPKPGYRYSPNMVVRVNYLPTHMFVYGNYGHYCYGDYYGFNPRRGRFYPWAVTDARFYDPLWVFFRTFRRDRFDYYRNRHQYYHDHNDYRPRHTWRDQRQFISGRNLDIGDALLAVGMNQLLNGDDGFQSRIRFDENRERWNREVDRSNRFRALREQRENAFRTQRDGQRETPAEIDLGPFRVRVNPDDVPNSINRGRDRADASVDGRGTRAEDRDRADRDRGNDRDRADADPREDRDRSDRDRTIKRGERRLPDPRDRGREKPESKPDLPDRPNVPNRPELPNRPGKPQRPDLPDRPDKSQRPDLPDRPDKSQRPDLPDRPQKPQKPQKPDVPNTKPGKGPQPKDVPQKPGKNIKQPDKKPGKGPGRGNQEDPPGKAKKKKDD